MNTPYKMAGFSGFGHEDSPAKEMQSDPGFGKYAQGRRDYMQTMMNPTGTDTGSFGKDTSAPAKNLQKGYNKATPSKKYKH